MTFDQNAVVDKTCVRFSLPLDDGETSAAISAKALVEYFGAEMNDASLLQSYQAHASTIHQVAARQGASTLDKGVLVTGSCLEAAGRRAMATS